MTTISRNFFVKSHGLGNDYIVLDSENIDFNFSEKAIRTLCDVHYGIGSDGILLKVPSQKADAGLKIYNPDGSEAEKSGNGLRIFCKYLYDYGIVKSTRFSVETLGGIVNADIIETQNNRANIITIDMGKAEFECKNIPVMLDKPVCLGEPLQIADKNYIINCVSIGNPHCVIIKDDLDETEIQSYGSYIENHPLFPNRINVQFAKIQMKDKVEILIWERGAGYTLASGSSSCAVAAVMYKLGLTLPETTIQMPGGELKINIDNNWNIRMTGEVKQIAEGVLCSELINEIS